MDYKLLNEKLSDFSKLRRETLISKSERDNEDYMPEWYEVYPFDGEIFIKFHIQMDSYGENETIKGIEFVKAKQQVITNFETI